MHRESETGVCHAGGNTSELTWVKTKEEIVCVGEWITSTPT